MIEKLKNRRGETLLETLLSVLIAALAILMFSNMIAATISSTTNERSWTDEVNQYNTVLEQRTGDATNGTITITSEDGTDLIKKNTSVKFYSCNYGGEVVISYDVP